jgi:hypothetical protein
MISQEWKDKIAEAIKYYQKSLRLEQWEVRISELPADNDYNMSIKSIEGRYVSVINIADDFANEPIEEKANNIIHELCHMPQQRLDDQISYMVRDGSLQVKNIVEDIFRLEMEYITDWQTTVFAKLIPIPDCLKE